jgi:hypothetical protein
LLYIEQVSVAKIKYPPVAKCGIHLWP